ncbi:MAG: outer membrane lipoprotein carrier protein LolA [Acidisphaera sp.]|nr:outer membrane lipoprotein carrier protein LolA [Acidisphaera sp.]
MGSLAAVPSSRASFHEEKTIAALTRPVQDSGTLDYVRPAHLEKHTLTPVEEDLVVDGERLTITRPAAHSVQTLNLEEQPEIRALVDTIRGTLAGDLGLLRRLYQVTLAGSQAAWRLTLVPTDGRLQRFLRVVWIDGAGASLRAIDTVQVNGDRTRMTIDPS